ncbi:MAG: hypothetical protein BWY71_01119 [Planctomycetes bacterium ADurb.Bin412]|nr:MAG: hypothetical protein BWY71_01119 [Planctomycetes bacterium ADurb.Bin412]
MDARNADIVNGDDLLVENFGGDTGLFRYGNIAGSGGNDRNVTGRRANRLLFQGNRTG